MSNSPGSKPGEFFITDSSQNQYKKPKSHKGISDSPPPASTVCDLCPSAA